MTAVLIFTPSAIPRTTTRQQWREIDRWRRVTQRELDRHRVASEQAMRDLGAFGNATIMLDMAHRLSNPPVIIWP